MWCIINLPNGTQQAVKLDPKAMGQECLEKVCRALGIICEMEYFGLEHWSPNQKETRSRQWINLRNRLSCDNISGVHLMLALRVKFWVPVHFILQESVRNLFYMQAKADLLEGRLNARNWNNAAKLAALMCQADGIHFNESALKCECPFKISNDSEKWHHHNEKEHKSSKDKEHILSFKKRRLSKQKPDDNMECHTSTLAASANTAASSKTTSLTVDCGTSCTLHKFKSKNTDDTQNVLTTATSTAIITPVKKSDDSAFVLNADNISSTVNIDKLLTTSPLRIYKDYVVCPSNKLNGILPENFLRQIAVEHSKLLSLKITQKSAKYWLLQEIQTLDGYGEEVFTGVTVTEPLEQCDIAVGTNGVNIVTGYNVNNIPFSAIAAAKSFRRTFKLEYIDSHNDRRDVEIKLPKHAIAAGLYRSITERHAFYVCDKVRGVVTSQFTRDLKGTIASMFKEDTELGKRYIFDVQRTSREVQDRARRILHDFGMEPISISQREFDYEQHIHYLPKLLTTNEIQSDRDELFSSASISGNNALNEAYSITSKLDLVLKAKEEREALIERCVDIRVSEAMTCKICMDRAINTMFNPCCHVMACDQCAARCENCPNCRVKIDNVIRIYLPPELRIHPNRSMRPNTKVSTLKYHNIAQSATDKMIMTASK